jgi:hypothetical protein
VQIGDNHRDVQGEGFRTGGSATKSEGVNIGDHSREDINIGDNH